MSAWVVVLLAVVGALVLARLTRHRPESRRKRSPKPGEGMRRREHYASNPPGDDMVTVRHAVPPEEAHVVIGLLESAGIRAGMTSSRGAYLPKWGPRAFDVHVDADQAGEARDLLA